jgi:hypothetical protein
MDWLLRFCDDEADSFVVELKAASRPVIEARRDGSEPSYGQLAKKASKDLRVRVTIPMVKNACQRINGGFLSDPKPSYESVLEKLKSARTIKAQIAARTSKK